MIDMPRPRPPHLHHERTRHGAMVWVVRVGKGPRTRLRATYGTPEFRAEYEAALAGRGSVAPRKPTIGTLRWLWDRYRDSSAWTRLSTATRRQRENIMLPVLEISGKEPFNSITRSDIISGRDRRSATPSMARHFIDTMRGMFEWALDAELIKADPTQGVKVPKKATDGHHVWTDDEIAAFESRWPIGTRERLAFDVMLYTGLRRGDASRLGRQHIRNGIITLRTEKTGEVVTLAVLPPLAASIAATKTGDMALIATADGAAMTKESFGNWFGKACRDAKVPGSAHGIRKAAATRMADNGASESQLEAVFGWRGGGMASLYTKKANRSRLAKGAASLLLPEQNQDIYSRTSMGGEGLSPNTKGKSNV